MLLTANIGNTLISVGIFENSSLLSDFSVGSTCFRSADEYLLLFSSLIEKKGLKGEYIDSVIVSSVVPSITNAVTEALEALTGCRVLLVGPGLRSGFKIKIDHPAQLGADIVASTAGAIKAVGSPVIVADIGSATVVSAVDATGSFVSCSIMPGIEMGLNALSGAELLHGVFSDDSLPIIAKNTQDSMRSGTIIGTALSVKGFAELYKKELSLPGDTKLVVTGEYADRILHLLPSDTVFAPKLTLTGLSVLYELNQKNSHKK